jgi:hypothetical protein
MACYRVNFTFALPSKFSFHRLIVIIMITSSPFIIFLFSSPFPSPSYVCETGTVTPLAVAELSIQTLLSFLARFLAAFGHIY